MSQVMLKTLLTNLPLLCISLTFLTPTVRAEIWLSDELYLENRSRIAISPSLDDQDSRGKGFSDFKFTHGLGQSQIQLGSKLAFDERQQQLILNNLNLTTSISASDPSPFPDWQFTLGRQTISFAQGDMFATSLSKNQTQAQFLNTNHDRNYTQGLLIQNQLGFIQQEIMINHDPRREFNYHYQLYLGVPGYKVGPLKLVLEYLPEYEDNPEKLIALLSSALQFPLASISNDTLTGDWQWAFQYAKQFDSKNSLQNGSQTSSRAFQTSLSWLGFIPQHHLGLQFSYIGNQWENSDDFGKGQETLAVRYQFNFLSGQQLELGVSRRIQPESIYALRFALNYFM